MSEILLTSFKRSLKLPISFSKYSVAVYQPKGFNYPKLRIFEIVDHTGRWIRPSNFVKDSDPLISYRDTLYNLYSTRKNSIENWFNSIIGQDVALCCWCPYDRAAQRQLKEHGSFVCHTEVIRYFAKYLGFNLDIDFDRQKMKVLI